MALRFTGNMNAINRRFLDARQEINEKYIRVLRYCGEMAINEARTNGSYKDQTGNLRASKGYAIIIDGKIVDENFAGSNEGVSHGKSMVNEVLLQQPEIALVVVAGMNYASHVESRGFNVLTSAEQMANRVVPNLLKQLK